VNQGKIRGFLLQLPKPSLVRITGDGEPQELKPGKSYTKTAETICALAPELIECLDSDGKVIRAMRTDTPEAQRSTAAELPQVLQTDPHAAMLTHFANLLHRAYEHSTEIAFTRLVELTERMGDRADAIEQRLERTESANRRLLQDQVDDAFERAQEVAEQAAAAGQSGDLLQNMAGAFLSGHLQPKGAAPRTNGHAPKPPAPKGS
jgi:ribosomal protein L17